MLDRIISAKSKDVFVDDYSPSQAIKGYDLLNRDSNKLAVVFPPWHGGGKLTERLLRRLQDNRWAVLSYNFHDQILEPNIERVPQSYETIQAEVATDLDSIQESAGYSRIHFIGMSLGTMAMTLVAREYPDFSSATFLIPCSKLASSMWEGSRTQNIRHELSKQGYTKGELEEAWRSLEPRAYSESFRGKAAQTIISTTDKIILPRYQHEMNDSLKKAGSHVSDSCSRLGHGASIVKYCFSGKI